ncbi:hypothetical protein R1flu_029153 [Riccia fluitans]|uniref:Uncharacterized protein n=1 Tax=Riccia fluitans TaxID=41844 RepID=A0ABD1XNQ0_9MARC
MLTYALLPDIYSYVDRWESIREKLFCYPGGSYRILYVFDRGQKLRSVNFGGSALSAFAADSLRNRFVNWGFGDPVTCYFMDGSRLSYAYGTPDEWHSTEKARWKDLGPGLDELVLPSKKADRFDTRPSWNPIDISAADSSDTESVFMHFSDSTSGFPVYDASHDDTVHGVCHIHTNPGDNRPHAAAETLSKVFPHSLGTVNGTRDAYAKPEKAGHVAEHYWSPVVKRSHGRACLSSLYPTIWWRAFPLVTMFPHWASSCLGLQLMLTSPSDSCFHRTVQRLSCA